MSALRIICILLVLAPTLNSQPTKWTYVYMDVIATAYEPSDKCCGKFADGKTATGRNAFLPGVAVDPSVIPLGAYLDIPGYTRGPNNNGSWIRADDTGGAIKGHRIDVRFKTYKEAIEWGRKKIRIRVWTSRRLTVVWKKNQN